MLSQERHQAILRLLKNQNSVAVAELVELFGVSEMTVRRDLDALERQGLLHRVHGGAIGVRGRSYEPPFLNRSMARAEEKERIGRLAASLVQEGDSVALDVGTTTLEIAKQLRDRRNLTIVTPSFRIAGLLAEQPHNRIILTGGILRSGELSLVGRLAEDAFRHFYVDKLFLGVGRINLDEGLTEYNLEDAQVKQAMLRSAKEVIVVADASKFGRVAFAAVASLDQVDRIITDASLDTAFVEALQAKEIEVLLA